MNPGLKRFCAPDSAAGGRAVGALDALLSFYERMGRGYRDFELVTTRPRFPESDYTAPQRRTQASEQSDRQHVAEQQMR